MCNLYRTLMATRAAQPAPRPAPEPHAVALTDEQVAAVDEMSDVMTRGRLDYWPTSEGLHIVAATPEGVVRQVGGLWK